MKKMFAVTAFAAVITLAGNVHAHGAKPQHGGIVQSASDLTFELVHKDGIATIYVDDHGKALPTAGARGTFTVLNGADKAELPLEAGANNLLLVKGKAKLVPGSKVVAAVTFADRKAIRVRFALK